MKSKGVILVESYILASASFPAKLCDWYEIDIYLEIVIDKGDNIYLLG